MRTSVMMCLYVNFRSGFYCAVLLQKLRLPSREGNRYALAELSL